MSKKKISLTGLHKEGGKKLQVLRVYLEACVNFIEQKVVLIVDDQLANADESVCVSCKHGITRTGGYRMPELYTEMVLQK